MKKIAILTWFNRGRNYGQTLQAFALYHTLTKMGHICEMLSYGEKTPRISEEEINELTGSARQKQIIFTVFMKLHFKYSSRLKSKENIEQYLLENGFDAVVCGSDQIWNPATPSGLDMAYLLDFDLPCRKISYAPSMVDIRFIAEYEKYPRVRVGLEKFDAVSVRENSARTIVQRLTDGAVDPAVVLDPTLLLTRKEWEQVLDIPTTSRETYIFCYMFHISPDQTAALQELAKKMNCSTVIFSDVLNSDCPILEGIHVELAEAVSIETFLSLIRDASAVFVDSFHGAAFSIQFEKLFFPVESDPGEIAEGKIRNIDRMATLLEKAGLTDRLIRCGQEDKADLTAAIDYNDVQERLAHEREYSITWLKNAIG